MHPSFVAILLGAALINTGAAGETRRSKESQGAVKRPDVQSQNESERRATPQGYSYGTGTSEVAAVNFVVAANSCIEFSSFLDLMGSDTAGIAILALGIDIRQTRVIPFFGVDGAPYMVASGKILQGDSFYYYMDAGSGTVPVLGRQLLLRVCNDASDSIRYTQLTVYVSHR